MIDITFLPGKNAPRNILPVTYHVNQWNHEAALKIARKVFKKEHGKYCKYYKDVAMAETRII